MDTRVQVKQEVKMLLRAESVATLTDLPIETVYRLIREGRIPSISIEGTTRRLVPMSKLREWIQAAIKAQIGEPAP